jgi:hypothetical protein
MNPITAPVHSSLSGTAVKTGKGTSTALRGLDLERLVILSAPAMEDLYRQLDSPTTTVLLADSQGGVLRAIGSGCDVGALPGAPQEAAQVAARALPALLDEAAPEPAHLAAHLPANLAAQRVGIAVPILPPDGGLLGFVDTDASPLDWLSHANALLQTAARIIEHRLIEADPKGFLLLRFHRYPTVLGTPLEALALFDADGGVLLANRVAIDLLAPCSIACGVPVASCFATQWCGIVGYAALGLRQPFVLRDHRGADYSARASLRRAAA